MQELNNILNYIKAQTLVIPDKPAIIVQDGSAITYADLYQRMCDRATLPIPLLGDSWDSDFYLKTTGTTGKSKTVIISQQAVIANSQNLIHAHGYSSDTVFIVAGALDHLGGWSKIFPTLMVGGTLIILDGIKDVNAFFRALDYDSAHLATFLVPASIRMLLQFSADKLASYSDKIEFIETGAAPISHSDMLRLCQLLPRTRLFNTYASTETGIVCSYNFNDGRTKAGCCGKPLPASQVFITESGTIACKGKTLMSAYLGEPEMTAIVLKDQCIYTADSGYIDDEGMLHVLGRNDDIINIGGYKVDPVEVENRALAYDGIEDCICIADDHPVLGNIVKLLVKTNNDKPFDKKQLAWFIAQTLDQYKVPTRYERVATINRTSNGKLDRKSYRNK